MTVPLIGNLLQKLPTAPSYVHLSNSCHFHQEKTVTLSRKAEGIQLIKIQVLIKFVNPRIYIYVKRKHDFEEKLFLNTDAFFQENKSEFREIYMLEF